MNRKKFLKLMPLVALLLVCGAYSAEAGKPTTYTHYTSALVTSEGYYTGAYGTETLLVDANRNITSASETVTGAVTAASLTVTGNSKFQGSLFSSGHYTASTVLFSSSTAFRQANLPYAIVLKAIGNQASETSLLPTGLPGQDVQFQIYGAGPAGTWILKPDTAAATPVAAILFTSLTFNAVGQTATMEYLNDTLGWFAKSIGTTASTAAPTLSVPLIN